MRNASILILGPAIVLLWDTRHGSFLINQVSVDRGDDEQDVSVDTALNLEVGNDDGIDNPSQVSVIYQWFLVEKSFLFAINIAHWLRF
jgi:hypothetical protein